MKMGFLFFTGDKKNEERREKEREDKDNNKTERKSEKLSWAETDSDKQFQFLTLIFLVVLDANIMKWYLWYIICSVTGAELKT